jgi:hypothetical protein
LGSSVLAASLVSGIAMTFWRESGYSSRLLIQATLGPLYIGVVFLLPITLPVMLVLAIMVFVGSRLRRIWLSALAFVLMGAYWLWLVKLILEEAFD